MNVYEKALAIATKAHEGQVDKAGIDYIQHPLYVASLVEGEETKATALLHDVVEDSTFTIEDLKAAGIPANVVEAVAILTKNKQITYFDYLAKVKENDLARQVKLADLQHNSDLSRLKEVSEEDRERREKYLKAMEYLR